MASTLVPSFALAAQASAFAHILPDVAKQVVYAKDSIDNKAWNRAIAHSDLILFSRPIKVAIDYDHRSMERREECLESARQAFDFWKKELNQSVQFEMSQSAWDADIIMTFQPQAINRGTHVGGSIQWKRTVRILGNDVQASTHADITISTTQPNRRDMSMEAMRHAVTHELGHVLGLDDSEKIGDIMGPIRPDRPAFTIMDSERQALLNLREQVLQLRTYALAERLSALGS